MKNKYDAEEINSLFDSLVKDSGEFIFICRKSEKKFVLMSCSNSVKNIIKKKDIISSDIMDLIFSDRFHAKTYKKLNDALEKTKIYNLPIHFIKDEIQFFCQEIAAIALSHEKLLIRLRPYKIDKNRDTEINDIGELYDWTAEKTGDGFYGVFPISEKNLDKKAINFVNIEFCKMLGYRKNEILGRNVRDFLDKENIEIMNEEVKRREKGVYTEYKMAWKRKDGTNIDTMMHPQPI